MAFVVLVAAASPATALAQEPSAYDRLVDEALAEFEAGHYEEALSAFEQAYKEKPSARALRGVAKALFELRSYARCVATIERALATEVDPLPENLRADLESLKTRALRFVGDVAVTITPSRATVVIDGRAMTSGTTRALDVGTHTVEASAPDHHPLARRFEIHGRETTTLTLALDPVGVVAPAPSPAGSSTDSRTLPLALTIGAVVLATGAVVGSSVWLADRVDAVDRCNDAAAAGARCANEGPVAFQQNAATGTVILSGGALVVSAVALWFVLRGDQRGAPATPATRAMTTAMAF